MSSRARNAEPEALPADEVHVWRVELEPSADEVAELARTLAEEERERAARFHFARDRRRYVVARATLRRILAGYLDADPSEVAFTYAAAGKPELARPSAAPGAGPALRFNVSHAHERALVAVNWGRRIGVDIEWIRSIEDREGVARRFFSEGERFDLETLGEAERGVAFFTCWTRKEAYLKATGAGVTAALDGFRVSLLPGEPARLLETRDDPDERDRWTLAEVPCGEGYVGALAVEGRDWRLVPRTWTL